MASDADINIDNPDLAAGAKSRRGRLARLLETFITVLILLNLLIISLETVEAINEQYGKVFKVFEAFSIIVFTFEYFYYLYKADKKLSFIFSFAGLLDLMVILPFYLPFIGVDLRGLRALRLIRIARVFKLARYNEALNLINHVVVKQRFELYVSGIIMVLMFYLGATFIYFAEHEAQPEHFSSIPATLSWCVTSLSAFGAKTCAPVTPVGKLTSVFMTILGVCFFALPMSILGAGFVDELNLKAKKQASPDRCPHCRKKL